MATTRSTLRVPTGASGVLSAIKGSDSRSHPQSNLAPRKIKPKPYVPLGKSPR